MSGKSSVTVIVLNWNGRELLEDCLGSLEKVDYNHFNILVVDNGSTDDSVEYVTSTFPNVDILELNENLGFAAGNNAGFKHAVLAYNMKFVIFLNNDTIVDENFIKSLLLPFNDLTVGQTAPKIFYESEKEKIWYAGGKVNLWTGNIFHEGIRKIDTERFKKIKNTDYATGCCFCIKTSDFEKLNGFDESFRMYGEDVDLSLRVMKSGKNVIFIPESKIYHKVSASIGGAFSLQKIKRKGLANMKLMFKYAQPYQWLVQLICLPFLIFKGIVTYFRYR
jgi:hypothetical protein